MKKLFAVFVLVIAFLAVNAAAQSVADAARANRAHKKPNPSAQVIDNDVIPAMVSKSPETTVATSNAQTGSTESTAPAATGKDNAKDADKDKKADAQGKADPEEWKKKIADQKKEIAQLQRELDVAEREARLRAAAYYADAGMQLRDQARFAEDNRKAQAEIDTKKQALAGTKQKLEQTQEDARKAGIPASQID
ncbi:MAG: hypothetical protein DMG65_26850 [Candidatus Angelobacter sp. Gp1-AA117]|nr:MAG: hypothetical protein DMG65_26850 [Candidatus Angelobacter sp. Gp1-AA117]